MTLRIAILIGLLLRLFVAIWNGFFGPSFGAELDALTFHIEAVQYARNPTFDGLQIGWIYAYLLGLIYHFTTASLFLGSLLSCLAWLASAYLLVKIMRLLSVDKSHQFAAMLIYALLPSSIMLTSVTLREPYQLLFVHLAMYANLEIYLNKSSIHWLILFCAVIGMSILHAALLAFGLFVLIAMLTLLAFRGRENLGLGKLTFAAPFIALIVIYGFTLFTSVAYNLDDGMATAVGDHQQGGLGTDARANYKTSVEISGVVGLLLFVPESLFQYLFEPMPWRISTTADVVVLFENILRAWLIWKAWTGLRKMPMQERRRLASRRHHAHQRSLPRRRHPRRSPPPRRLVLLVCLFYLVIETIWSLGTLNWGTAMRHHLPSIGLLVIAAFAYSAKKTGLHAKSRAKKPAAAPQ